MLEDIKTFAILDVEVNDYYKYQFNQCSLTELCMYAIPAKCLQNDIIKNGRVTSKSPKLPRILHKIKLMINPLRRIQDHTRTGLDNYMLENEAPFDVETADCILKFLNRLQKPVCLVAHNGLEHDFRLIRHIYEKINLTFPSSIYCVDSLPAFRKIDKEIEPLDNAATSGTSTQKREEEGVECRAIISTSNDEKQKDLENSSDNPKDISLQNVNETSSTINEESTTDSKFVEEISHISRQQINETTPNNKRVLLQSTAETDSLLAKRPTYDNKTRVKRQLNFNNQTQKQELQTQYSYELGVLYESVFKDEKCEVLHHAEADVDILTKLILHYGKEFLKYAEENKQSFDKVLMLGAYTE